MSQDADVKRKTPTTWKEYLHDTTETYRVAKWVWHKFQTPDSSYWLKRFWLYLVITMLLTVVQPYAVSFIFNGIQTRDIALVYQGLAALLLSVLVAVHANRKQARAREWAIGLRMGYRDDYITMRLLEKSSGQHIRHSEMLGVPNIDKGRWRIHDMETLMLFEGVAALLGLILSFGFLWFLGFATGLLASLMVVVHLVWSLYLNLRLVKDCVPIEKDFRLHNRVRVERWEKNERVKSCGKETEEVSFLRGDFERIIAPDRKFWLWYNDAASRRSLMNNIIMFLIMCYGVWRVWNHDWSMGLLFPLFAWSQRLLENLWFVNQVEHKLNWNMPSVRSFIKALEIAPDVIVPGDAIRLDASAGFRIEFKNISHTYPGQNTSDEDEESCAEDVSKTKPPRPVLKDIDFTLEPGEKVALLGISGAGKSTLMRFLLRQMDPSSGAVLINGHDLRAIELSSWLANVGYIPQHPQIFDSTLRYNLEYSLTPEQRAKQTVTGLWEHMRKFCIDFGDRLSQGLETRVGKNGLQLSGGEQQRLMIGAAMLKKPGFVIIDEATSNLDSLTEFDVQESLNRTLEGNVGALVVAHRLSTVKNICTKFIVMKPSNQLTDGEPQIEAMASSFTELYKISPTFRALADKQGLDIN